MDVVPSRLSSDGDPRRLACAKQANVDLDRLLAVLFRARSDMRTELASRPPDARRLLAARGRLLESLEAYTSGLAARNLSPPPKLRDELALQRNLASQMT